MKAVGFWYPLFLSTYIIFSGFGFQAFLSEADIFHGLGQIDEIISFLQGLPDESIMAYDSTLSTL